jgi:hypothetical protein
MAKTPTEIKSLARSHSDTAVRVLAGIMNDSSAPHAARVTAANSIIDRGWGKPPQAIIGGDEDDPALKIIHEIRRTIVSSGNPDSESLPPAT